MALLPILTFPDPRLHKIAAPVRVFDDALKTLVRDLAETMYASPGVGLAATQVNVHQRVITIDTSDTHDDLLVLVNPRILKADGKQFYEVPWFNKYSPKAPYTAAGHPVTLP